jgi:hypothetical protein
MIPTFATHYHLSNRQPFLSLSDLEGDSEHSVFQELLAKHRHDPSYRRRYGQGYLKTRRLCEDKLRCLFQARGGLPQRRHPYYLVLGESDWFLNLNDGHRSLKIPLAELPPRTTSITFPDSFLAMTAANKPYYEKVFLLEELAEVVEEYGYRNAPSPAEYDRYWEGDFEHYIEIQVWDDGVVEPYRRQWRCQQTGACDGVPATHDP